MAGKKTTINTNNMPQHTGIGPDGESIIQRDSKVMSTSYTREYPLVVDRAKGAHVWDVDGNEFIDMMSGIAVAATGHAHPKVVEAVKAQAERFLHICLSDFYYEVGVELAEKLSAIKPFSADARLFFTNSGTETIEAAIKLARYATGRKRFIAFQGAFHGRTMGSLALTYSKPAQQGNFFPVMPGAHHAPYPYTYRPLLHAEPGEDYGEVCVRYIEETLFKRYVPADQVAAVFVEALQGEGGYVVPTPGFLPALRDLCDRHGMLLVVDEIQSGVGRTGKWWAVEHFGVEPDIVASAKGLASGMPLGALMARENIMEWKPGSHGSTFGGNPVACAAAVATLDVIEEEGLLDHTTEMGAYIMERLNTMCEDYDIIGEVRGMGLMIGMEIVTDKASKKAAPHLRNAIIDEAFKRGVLFLGCGDSTLRLMPALNIDQPTVDRALDALNESLAHVQAHC